MRFPCNISYHCMWIYNVIKTSIKNIPIKLLNFIEYTLFLNETGVWKVLRDPLKQSYVSLCNLLVCESFSMTYESGIFRSFACFFLNISKNDWWFFHVWTNEDIVLSKSSKLPQKNITIHLYFHVFQLDLVYKWNGLVYAIFKCSLFSPKWLANSPGITCNVIHFPQHICLKNYLYHILNLHLNFCLWTLCFIELNVPNFFTCTSLSSLLWPYNMF